MKKKLSLFLPIIIIATIIFISSSQSYEQQNITPYMEGLNKNSSLEHFLAKFNFTYGGKEVSVANSGVAHFLEFFIRKLSHLTIYALLAIFITRAFLAFQSKKRSILYAILCTILYAISDEVHQTFTNGRTGLASDVIIDTIGGMIGITIYVLVKRKGK